MCSHFQNTSIWKRHQHFNFIIDTCFLLVSPLPFCFRKKPYKSKFSTFLNSKGAFGGNFHWNMHTHFQKRCTWTRHEHSKFIGETEISLVALLCLKHRQRSVHSLFVCIHFQKICGWIKNNNTKFMKDISVFLVTLLRFCFQKSALKILIFWILLPLKELLVNTSSETCALTYRKGVFDQAWTF